MVLPAADGFFICKLLLSISAPSYVRCWQILSWFPMLSTYINWFCGDVLCVLWPRACSTTRTNTSSRAHVDLATQAPSVLWCKMLFRPSSCASGLLLACQELIPFGLFCASTCIVRMCAPAQTACKV